MLVEKKWIGFDLDDTLHEFRRSSKTATEEVLKMVATRYDLPTSVAALMDIYTKTLKAQTANAFSDGKTSFQYRQQRFSALLSELLLPEDTESMSELLETYESTLKASLKLKCGALELLSTIKNMGKKIVVITEGPQDAQERTVKDLGIDKYIDLLATTNYFRLSKLDGLYPKVIQHLGVSPSDMAYVGDNEQRDMEPAMAEGILCFHLAEDQDVSLGTVPSQINTLRNLQYTLADGK
ncbi:HAD-superfamily hydrolase, subfamily IA, variant 1 [Xylariaceae sp. FL1272]|nr:HAD-superfamily hydrolase, subfamily IA, variant 1 [Xylariaceae sp. FL1272]